MDQAKANLLEDQSSRKKEKQIFIVFLIIFFTVLIICAIVSVFTLLKHHTESHQSLSPNPIKAIRASCRVTRYYFHCMKSLSSQLPNPTHKIHASDIFRLSIDAALHKLLIIYELPRKLDSKIENKSIMPVLIDCQNLLNHSLNQVNTSLIMIIENYDEGMMNDLRVLMDKATKNVERCVDGLDIAGKGMMQWEIIVRIKKVRERIKEAEKYMLISLDILEKKDSIGEVFDPSLQSILASFMLTEENYVLSILVFCSQYLFLAFLFCTLLRVFK